jgi:glycosyltransferase involved in cell wall biosynthesis
MLPSPQISVIVIFLNGEPFMEETIQSVLAQSYKNWELLLVDDGSTDGSTDLALRYAQTYPHKVSYLEHEDHQNKGMSATRNLGIQKAKGDYVAFLDADDIWLPETLAEQLTLLISHPKAAMVYGPIQWWSSWTGDPEEARYDFIENPGVRTDSLHQPPTLLLKMIQREIAISGMLIRKHVIMALGGFEERFRNLYEDQVFCAKVCLNFPVYVASQCWYLYRQHNTSSCSIAAKARQERIARKQFLIWLKEYLYAYSDYKTGSVAALRRELYKQLIYASNPVFYALSRPKQLCFNISRRILPASIRDWLWIAGQPLYQLVRTKPKKKYREETL